MKYSKILLLMTLFLHGIFTLNGQPVNEYDAKRIAKTHLTCYGHGENFLIRSDPKIGIGSDGSALYYVFAIIPTGYVVISADQQLPPVIAYSFSNTFESESGDRNVLFEILEKDLNNRLMNIGSLSHEIIEKRKSDWENLLSGKLSFSGVEKFEQWPPEGTTSTGGWLETNWSQGTPYNNFCPMDPVTLQRSIAGCPSVAISMIINYFKELNETVFTDLQDDYYHSYAGRTYWVDDDFATIDFLPFPEINAYFDTITESFNQNNTLKVNEMAALVWASGIAAKQVYTSSISGTFGVGQAYEAFQRFGYQNALLLEANDTSILTKLTKNMKEARPALLAVIDPGVAGHNLVTDGYNTEGYYHLNFGWNGSYNGWYLIPDEIPYNLTVFEGVVVDIAFPAVFTSVENKNQKHLNINIYPNPASDNIVIEVEPITEALFSVELVDVRGNICFSCDKPGLFSSGSFCIEKNVYNELARGVYFCRVRAGKNSVAKKVIVK